MGVLIHPNVLFQEARISIENSGVKIAETEEHIKVYTKTSDITLLVDGATAKCLNELHHPPVYTVLTYGTFLTERFAAALCSIRSVVQEAKSNEKTAFAFVDYGNEVNCFNGFMAFIGDLNRLKIQYQNFDFCIVNNENCKGLMQYAAKARFAVIA